MKEKPEAYRVALDTFMDYAGTQRGWLLVYSMPPVGSIKGRQEWITPEGRIVRVVHDGKNIRSVE